MPRPKGKFKICPMPIVWNDLYERALKHAARNKISIRPPVPLVLSGWYFSNDQEKMDRWKEFVAWAEENRYRSLVTNLSEADFYYVNEISDYTVGPNGGPMYLTWDLKSKIRPSPASIDEMLSKLRAACVAGAIPLSNQLDPLVFTGPKCRRLIFRVIGKATPPWGTWTSLSKFEKERRCFTAFRAAINKLIAPHVVDHVDFIVDESEQKVA